jgi:hypothetical protein
MTIHSDPGQKLRMLTIYSNKHFVAVAAQNLMYRKALGYMGQGVVFRDKEISHAIPKKIFNQKTYI